MLQPAKLALTAFASCFLTCWFHQDIREEIAHYRNSSTSENAGRCASLDTEDIREEVANYRNSSTLENAAVCAVVETEESAAREAKTKPDLLDELGGALTKMWTLSEDVWKHAIRTVNDSIWPWPVDVHGFLTDLQERFAELRSAGLEFVISGLGPEGRERIERLKVQALEAQGAIRGFMSSLPILLQPARSVCKVIVEDFLKAFPEHQALFGDRDPLLLGVFMLGATVVGLFSLRAFLHFVLCLLCCPCVAARCCCSRRSTPGAPSGPPPSRRPKPSSQRGASRWKAQGGRQSAVEELTPAVRTSGEAVDEHSTPSINAGG